MEDSKRTRSFGAIPLDTTHPIWDRCFTIAPLVLIGTREADGRDDLAPKHLAGPLGWANHFGFVCTPRHATYRNIRREGVFAVTFPKPTQWLETSLSAAPRADDDRKPSLSQIATRRSDTLDCPVVVDGYLFLECELERIVDDFGENSLIAGRIVAASADPAYLRSAERDDQDVLHDAPLLAYVSPGRFAVVSDTLAFPMPQDMKR